MDSGDDDSGEEPQRGLTAGDRLMWPEVAEWEPLLLRLGLDRDAIVQLALRASIAGVSVQSEILASGSVREDVFYRALADELGIAYADRIDPRSLIVSDRTCLTLLRSRSADDPALLNEPSGPPSVVMATDRLDLAVARRRVRESAGVRHRWKVVPRSVFREALLTRASGVLMRRAVLGLFNRFPQQSARSVATALQGFLVGAATLGIVVALVFWPPQAFFILHVVFSILFLGCVVLRFAAAVTAAPPQETPLQAVLPRDLPVYTVLVALYRETEVIPQLLLALSRLQWPRAKLDVKLVCEKDDHATLTMIRAQQLRPWVEIVEVPPVGPRTKPKALAYALPLARGELVALYDAEDRPHPLQLMEAFQAFRAAGPDCACLQAPLEVSNREDSLIARMFAFEYAALFRGLLPWLSRHRLVLPLGGTSNHFRRGALEAVGGWDPFNVTEDADLGLRLARFGFRTGTITRPTWEMAPEDLTTWLPQRTRWLKGWMHTWLVHMRHPFRLLRQIGLPSFLIVQLLFAGMVISAIAHPVLIFVVIRFAVEIALNHRLDTDGTWLLVIDGFNVVCGYLSFLMLGWRTMQRGERASFWKIVLFMPVYWLWMSVAGVRAVWHLLWRPHLWEKTPHRAGPEEPTEEIR